MHDLVRLVVYQSCSSKVPMHHLGRIASGKIKDSQGIHLWGSCSHQALETVRHDMTDAAFNHGGHVAR